MLHSSTAANAEASTHGGVVLSVSSPQGPASLVDITLGQVGAAVGAVVRAAVHGVQRK